MKELKKQPKEIKKRSISVPLSVRKALIKQSRTRMREEETEETAPQQVENVMKGGFAYTAKAASRAVFSQRVYPTSQRVPPKSQDAKSPSVRTVTREQFIKIKTVQIIKQKRGITSPYRGKNLKCANLSLDSFSFLPTEQPPSFGPNLTVQQPLPKQVKMLQTAYAGKRLRDFHNAESPTELHTSRIKTLPAGLSEKQERSALARRQLTREVTREWRRGQIHTTPHTAKIVEANEINTLLPGLINTAPVSGAEARKAVKTAKQQAAKRAAIQNIKRTKRVARDAVQTVKRAVQIIAKLSAAMLKGAAAMIGIGGVGVVVLLSVAIAGAFIASPFGIFFSSNNDAAQVQTTQPVADIVRETDLEFAAKIEAIKQEFDYADSVSMHYPGSVDNTKINNWQDVISVFAVKTSMDKNGMDVVTMDETRKEMIKNVFWDMNLINTYVEVIEDDDDTEYILHITVTSLNADEGARFYGFNDDQKDVLSVMLSHELLSYRLSLLGIDSSTGLTPDELEGLNHDLPKGEMGAEIVKTALTRLGDPYSMPKAGTGRYLDCSYLVLWSYAQHGINLPRTAAEQARYCVSKGLTVSYDELVPGDLIFWSWEDNGRFMGIGHVGIYIGNGKMVEASSTHGQVIVQKVYYPNQQVLYGRPHLMAEK